MLTICTEENIEYRSWVGDKSRITTTFEKVRVEKRNDGVEIFAGSEKNLMVRIKLDQKVLEAILRS